MPKVSTPNCSPFKRLGTAKRLESPGLRGSSMTLPTPSSAKARLDQVLSVSGGAGEGKNCFATGERGSKGDGTARDPQVGYGVTVGLATERIVERNITTTPELYPSVQVW